MSVQVLEALNTLHQVGYCHWDIKLDNVCYYNGTYNLIDFAYAQKLNPETSHTIKSFKGNSMFASIRKFQICSSAAPIDDFESLFYLIAFCIDGFYLPWLDAYINQKSTEQFIQMRLIKVKQNHEYLYENMPIMLAKGLRYIHRFHEKLNSMTHSDKLNQSMNSHSKRPTFDYLFIKNCLDEMLLFFKRRCERQNPNKIPSSSDSPNQPQNVFDAQQSGSVNQYQAVEFDANRSVYRNSEKPNYSGDDNSSFVADCNWKDVLNKLQYSLTLALLFYQHEVISRDKYEGVLDAPRGKRDNRLINGLLQQMLNSSIISDDDRDNRSDENDLSHSGISDQRPNFIYTSAHTNDLQQLRQSYLQMQSFEWKDLDARHPIAMRNKLQFPDCSDPEEWLEVENLICDTDENIDDLSHLKYIKK